MARISSSLLKKHKGLLIWSSQVETSDRENKTSSKVQLPKMCGLFLSAGYVTLRDLSQVSLLALWPPKLLADVYAISLKKEQNQNMQVLRSCCHWSKMMSFMLKEDKWILKV